MTELKSTLAWTIPWTEEPGGLQVTGWQRIRHNGVTNRHIHTQSRQISGWSCLPLFSQLINLYLLPPQLQSEADSLIAIPSVHSRQSKHHCMLLIHPALPVSEHSTQPTGYLCICSSSIPGSCYGSRVAWQDGKAPVLHPQK